jgi:hypothetical protein
MPTVAQLKKLLKARGLDMTGKKAELEARLAEDDAIKESEASVGKSEAASETGTQAAATYSNDAVAAAAAAQAATAAASEEAAEEEKAAEKPAVAKAANQKAEAERAVGAQVGAAKAAAAKTVAATAVASKAAAEHPVAMGIHITVDTNAGRPAAAAYNTTSVAGSESSEKMEARRAKLQALRTKMVRAQRIETDPSERFHSVCPVICPALYRTRRDKQTMKGCEKKTSKNTQELPKANGNVLIICRNRRI